MTILRTGPALAAAGALALALSSCASSSREPQNQSGAPSGSTVTFGAAGAPATFDPFYGVDGETFRPARQMFEGLVGFKPGTADLEPALAKSWKSAADGKTWTFELQTGVKFHDGTAFDAAAVCKNFTRMFDQNAAGQNAAAYWVDNMGGFKTKNAATGLFQGCTAKGASTVELKVSRPTSKFPALLGLPSFSMQSPTALEKYKANSISAQGDGYSYPEYAQKHPTGTGKFTFGSYDEANKVITLKRNDNYWDSANKAKPATVVFKIIPDETARKQALEAGTIDGYDLPSPVDWNTLKSKNNLQVRPAFNLLYVALNAKVNPDLKDLKVRQALMHAINRQQFVSSQLPEGAVVASQFIPSTVDGYNPDVVKYEYNPSKAKQLLAEAGKPNLAIKLWYPSEVSRPYMPDPLKVFQAVKSDWEKVGVKVTPVTKPWNGGYLTSTKQGQSEAHFLGWTGDYNTPDNFLANFFGSPGGAFNAEVLTGGSQMIEAIRRNDGIVDLGQRAAAYKALNATIMKDVLPGLPLSSSPPAIVFSKKLTGVVASPLTAEDFGTAVKQ